MNGLLFAALEPKWYLSPSLSFVLVGRLIVFLLMLEQTKIQ
jgi:hypothetical protein